ncbi:hypothetical protein [Amycolatopsis sp. Hca4]|uniref:hypothetical protein n=1 Tax=unclassified Amycolatopsis TaxID=2618356 RepID=UPI000CA13C6D|nr:hypothetical protein [Amycolatopsis sp. Hca4]ATV95632.1 hypothetical protein [Amycolatopsis sp.]QKV75120.1 hypothetical protein HUT10_16125 [Amycolatopsis sp. Hca4]
MTERPQEIFTDAGTGHDGRAPIRTDRVSEGTRPVHPRPRRPPVWDSDEFDAYDAFELDDAA